MDFMSSMPGHGSLLQRCLSLTTELLQILLDVVESVATLARHDSLELHLVRSHRFHVVKFHQVQVDVSDLTLQIDIVHLLHLIAADAAPDLASLFLAGARLGVSPLINLFLSLSDFALDDVLSATLLVLARARLLRADLLLEVLDSLDLV